MLDVEKEKIKIKDTAAQQISNQGEYSRVAQSWRYVPCYKGLELVVPINDSLPLCTDSSTILLYYMNLTSAVSRQTWN